MRSTRAVGHKYQLIFKGRERLDIEDELARFEGLGYPGKIPENPRGGSHLEVNVGEWFLQIYGAGTVNAFVMDKRDAVKVWRFLLSLGYTLSLEKIKPTRRQLWDTYDSSEDGKSSKEYPNCFKIIRTLEVRVLKCLLSSCGQNCSL